MTTRFFRLLCVFIGVACAPAWGADFRSVGDNAALLYDAPSVKAKKLSILGHNYPVEIVVVVEGPARQRSEG